VNIVSPLGYFADRKPRLILLLADLIVLAVAYLAAFYLRFDLAVPLDIRQTMWQTMPLLVVIGLVFMVVFEVYRGMWRYASINDLYQIIKALTATSVVFVLALYLISHQTVPRSVVVIQWLLSIIMVGGMRFLNRLFRKMISVPDRRIHVLIVGAGDAGDMIVRQLLNNPRHGYDPVGFIDDDPHKRNLRLHGVKVLGARAAISEIVERKGVQEVIVATSSATGDQMTEIVDACKKSGVKKIRTMPGIRELMEGEFSIAQLREIRLEDLLGRDPVTINSNKVSAAIAGKCVVVTGAGGSIGSELCRQILPYGPAKLVCVERTENNLYYLEQELRRTLEAKGDSGKLVPIICDVGNRQKLCDVFQTYTPHVVFHAAAHKHVPMMESFPDEAVMNNVVGTLNVLELADEHGAELMVLISTDKAVAPSCVMGASKRIGEQLLQSFKPRDNMRCVTVRFGNVLGSNGSVVPLFRQQIAQGGPVTVTHPDMKRYFMTIPEAVQLITQAAVMGKGGEVFILDMGEPVRIMDMVERLITLSGLDPHDDIEIEIIGLRPGEKLEEELWGSKENPAPTTHQKILMARTDSQEWDQLIGSIEELRTMAIAQDHDAILCTFKKMIPDFHPMEVPPFRPLGPSVTPRLKVISNLGEE
jgi:FlaA1/EpsC-like NDP-sugar epimerase